MLSHVDLERLASWHQVTSRQRVRLPALSNMSSYYKNDVAVTDGIVSRLFDGYYCHNSPCMHSTYVGAMCFASHGLHTAQICECLNSRSHQQYLPCAESDCSSTNECTAAWAMPSRHHTLAIRLFMSCQKATTSSSALYSLSPNVRRNGRQQRLRLLCRPRSHTACHHLGH
jgi:conjugal transfer/entry exclusion protein